MSIRNVIVIFFVHGFIWRRLWIENVWEHESCIYLNELLSAVIAQWYDEDVYYPSSDVLLDDKEVILPQKRFFFLKAWTAKYLVKVYQQLGKQILNSSYEFEMMLTRIATQTTGTWWSFYRNPDPQNDPASLSFCFLFKTFAGIMNFLIDIAFTKLYI